MLRLLVAGFGGAGISGAGTPRKWATGPGSDSGFFLAPTRNVN